MAKVVFDAGVALLTNTGTPEPQARSLVGKWRKNAVDEKLVALFMAAEDKVQPISYIEAALHKPKVPGDPFAVIAAHD